MKINERLQLAEEAGRLEAVRADWEAKHVAAILGCSVSTVFDTAWIRQCSRRIGRHRRWIPADLRAAQSRESAKRDARPFPVPRTRRRTA